MVHGVVETPKTEVGNATYLNQQDFDMSQEQSFMSPSKDNLNVFHQMGNKGRGLNFKTPRTRMAFGDKANGQRGFGGAEFTPLLKSATTNRAMMFGKENTGMPKTPGFLKPGGLDNIDEHELTPVPTMEGTMYGEDSAGNSYVNGTPIPRIDSSSLADSPINLVARRNGGPDSLSDGNQLSLREQENVIDKIEKENFGSKLKIHFLEEALRKAGPGFSEAALKENTELKVDKVTMQKELHRYRKNVTAAEREVESSKQQIAELQDKLRRGGPSQGSQQELDKLRRELGDKEAEIQELYTKLDEGDKQLDELDKLRDNVTDLEHDLREKDRLLDEGEDKVEQYQAQVRERDDEIVELEKKFQAAKKREADLNKELSEEKIDEAKQTIAELQQDIKKLKIELGEAKDEQEEALREKERAASDLEELQDELANKSVTSKGLSRQMEAKAHRLQDELEELKENHDNLRESHEHLEHDQQQKIEAVQRLQQRITELDKTGKEREQQLRAQLEEAIKERDNFQSQNQAVGGQLDATIKNLRKELEVAIMDRDHAESEKQQLEAQYQQLEEQLDAFERELRDKTDERDLLQIRHDALTQESSGLQRELARTNEAMDELKHELDHEKTLSLNSEAQIKEQYKAEIDNLHDVVEDLRADLGEKERLYDDDLEKWEKENRNFQSQRKAAEDQAADLKRTVENLQAVEGSLSGKEAKLQEATRIEKERNAKAEASLNKQVEELKQDLQSRQRTLEDVKQELANVREELRLSQREERALHEKVEALEDEIDVLQTEKDDDAERAQEKIRVIQQRANNLEKQLDSYKVELENASSRPTRTFAEQQSSQLRSVEDKLAQMAKNEQELKDQLSKLQIEMRNLMSHTTDIEVERDEVKTQLREIRSTGDKDHIRADQEKIDLRTAKVKLDLEARRLRDEAQSLVEQKATLEAELRVTREAAEDERLTYKEKDLEYLKKDVVARETIRDLKRQLDETERQAHNLEISLLQTSSPHSSMSSSGRKNELLEVRTQLANAHQNIKDLREQIRKAEREATKKLFAAHADLQHKTEEWEQDRFTLERQLQAAQAAKPELEAKNATAEISVNRLKAKVQRIEEELQNERRNAEGDRTMALEREDLHEMLKESQIQCEQLEMDMEARDTTIKRLTAAEEELGAQLRRVREERNSQRERADEAMKELRRLEHDFEAVQREWEAEKMNLTRVVRFPNNSISDIREDERELARQELEELSKRHVKELRGLAMQIEWLRARCRREEGLRADAAFAKRFMVMQIQLYGDWYVAITPSLLIILCDAWSVGTYANNIPVTQQTSKSSNKWASPPTPPAVQQAHHSSVLLCSYWQRCACVVALRRGLNLATYITSLWASWRV